MRGHALVLATSLLVDTVAGVAKAADTTEEWEVGATDYELYAGAEGLGLSKGDRCFWGETVVGMGLVERLAGHITVAGSTNETFTEGDGGFGFGLAGFPLDTDHFDLDLFLDFAWASGGLTVAPSTEVNLDLAPDRACWGLYVRVGEVLGGRVEGVAANDPSTPAVVATDARPVLAPVTELTVGNYWTVCSGHQLLVEVDGAVPNHPAGGERPVTIGGVALGYNVALTGAIELISEFYFDVPQDDERFSAAVSTGIIVTMPSTASARSVARATSPSPRARTLPY